MHFVKKINLNQASVWLFVLLFSIAGFSSCGKKNAPQKSVFDMTNSTPEADSLAKVEREKKRLGKKVGRIIGAKKDSAEITIDEQILIHNFMTEFGDGTVVTRVLIGGVRKDTTDAPRFYLVGQGQKSGRFQIMAFELFSSGDGDLFLNPISQKHICAANRCKFCYFTYVGNRINGCDCNDQMAKLRCTHTVNEKNTFFQKNKPIALPKTAPTGSSTGVSQPQQTPVKPR